MDDWAAGDTGGRRPAPLHDDLRYLWFGGVGVFALLFVAALAWSRRLWERFCLTPDFATYFQAWHLIGSGHLNPYDSTFPYNYPHYGYPFWQSHFELVMWPLAVLNLVWSSSYVLLAVQDLAVVLGLVVAFRFGLELVQSRWPVSAVARSPESSGASAPAQGRACWWRLGAGVGLLLLLLCNPWTYWVLSYDFHTQPIAVLFALLCARDAWHGRRRAFVFMGLALLCGDVAGSYIAAIGLAVLVSGVGIGRRLGAVTAATGLVWIALVAAVGSGKGSALAFRYAYLAHVTPKVGVAATVGVLLGVLAHPGDVLHVLRERFGELYRYLAGVGTIGVVTPLGLLVALAVLVPDALDQSDSFLIPTAAFQNYVVTLMVAVGAVVVFGWLVSIAARYRWGKALAIVVGVAAISQAAVLGAYWVPKIRPALDKISPQSAVALKSVLKHVPQDAELVASQGVVGRFGDHVWLYPFLDVFANGQTVPVNASTIVFVFVPYQGIELASTSQTLAAIREVRALPGVRTLLTSAQVSAFEWNPPKGTVSVQFLP
ncbi:MAG: hypothetical protein ACYDD4_01005 [Acidimicrobiales bacterium]